VGAETGQRKLESHLVLSTRPDHFLALKKKDGPGKKGNESRTDSVAWLYLALPKDKGETLGREGSREKMIREDGRYLRSWSLGK